MTLLLQIDIESRSQGNSKKLIKERFNTTAKKLAFNLRAK